MVLKYSTIGKFFKKARVSSGLSQLDVAKKLSYDSAQMISNWERGLCMPPSDKLHTLSNLLNIPKSDIIDLFLNETKKQLMKELKIKTIS